MEQATIRGAGMHTRGVSKSIAKDQETKRRQKPSGHSDGLR